MANNRVSHEDAQSYYEDFSLRVGERDWLIPNPRHEQLKLLMRDLLERRTGLRIADVGCGAGVMTDNLCRYGDVDGVDFSTAALAAARRFCGRANFNPGGLEALPGDEYDLIAAFDVLEHIPEGQRPGFLKDASHLLAPNGLLFFSTPYPAATRERRAADDPTLQIIDEEVELPVLLDEASEAGLQLVQFEAYDVFKGSPEYQAMVFVSARHWGSPPKLRPNRLDRRMALRSRRPVRVARRFASAARALQRRDVRTAAWFLRGTPPEVAS